MYYDLFSLEVNNIFTIEDIKSTYDDLVLNLEKYVFLCYMPIQLSGLCSNQLRIFLKINLNLKINEID